eukprot:1633710-Alexandrium_andersonii.AAC.1
MGFQLGANGGERGELVLCFEGCRRRRRAKELEVVVQDVWSLKRGAAQLTRRARVCVLASSGPITQL